MAHPQAARKHANAGATAADPHGGPKPVGHQVRVAPLTAAAFELKGNQACQSANARQAALKRPGDFATNSKAAASYLRQLVSIKSAEASGLRLIPPPALAASDNTFLGDLMREQLLIGLAAGQARAGKAGYAGQYQAAVSFAQGTTAPAAHQLGLTSCS